MNPQRYPLWWENPIARFRNRRLRRKHARLVVELELERLRRARAQQQFAHFIDSAFGQVWIENGLRELEQDVNEASR